MFHSNKNEFKMKQKVNDKCNCGSTKKYKKCCMKLEKAEQNIRPEYYAELDNEYREKYFKYMNVDSKDVSLKSFTEQQQIERYAKNVAFWQTQYSEAGSNFDKTDGKTSARSFFVSNQYAEIIDMVKDKFSEDIQKEIVNRADQIVNDNQNKVLSNDF
jgi:hypothetical protein